MANQASDGDEVIGAGGHHRQWVQIKADDVLENLPAKIAFIVRAPLAIVVVPFTDAVNRHDEKRAGTTRRVEQTFIRAKTQYGNAANSTQAVKLLEDAMGVYLRSPEEIT